MQLWCIACRQFVITPELLPEQTSLSCVMHYEYDADIWMLQDEIDLLFILFIRCSHTVIYSLPNCLSCCIILFYPYAFVDSVLKAVVVKRRSHLCFYYLAQITVAYTATLILDASVMQAFSLRQCFHFL